MTTKKPGHPCPKCHWVPCAEFSMKDTPARWSCTACDAGGLLAAPIAPPPAAPAPKKHWRDVARDGA